MASETEREASAATTPRPRRTAGWAVRWVVRHLGVLVPLAAYAVVVVTGATTSSLGVDELRVDPGIPLEHQWFEARDLRTDEYLTLTSQELGTMARGHSYHSPLAHTQDLTFQLSSGQPAETVLFWEYNLLRLAPLLPDRMVFAAVRGWPPLVLALALPPLLRRFGATTPLAWLAVALVLLAPTSVWWSFTPVRVLSHAALGSLLLLVSRDRWVGAAGRWGRIAALALAALGGLYYARFPTYYVPWYLTIGIPVVAATVAHLLLDRPRRAGLVVLGAGAVAGGLLLALVLRENADALRAALDTVYPGQRRSTGGALGAAQLLGAPGLGPLQTGVQPTVLNASELASAYLVCGVWALALLPWRPWPRTGPRSGPALGALVALSGVTLVWLSWCLTDWGTFGAGLPGFNLVPPLRAAQTLGYPAALVLVVMLSHASRALGRTAALVPALATAGVTAYAVHRLAFAIPTLDPTAVAATALAVGAAVWAITVWPRGVTVALASLLLLVPVYRVNPVLFGLADVRGTPAASAAHSLGAAARAEGGFVASTSIEVTALLIDNGAPTVTGWQISGPDREAWSVLDPTGQYEVAWNRGASYLTMTLDQPPGGAPVVTAPTPAFVNISLDPCGIPPDLRVTTLVVSNERTEPCLALIDQFAFSGRTQYAYRVEAP